MKKLPPLSPEVEALLAPHRRVSPLAPSVEARALARATAAMEWAEPAPFRPLGRPWLAAAAAGAVVALCAAAYAAHVWRGWPASTTPARVARIAVSHATERRPPAAVATEGETEASATIAPAPPRSRHAAVKVTTTIRPTNAELQLLRLAREDLTRSDYAGALAVVAEHARRFRNGGLVEEREALRVKSLAGLGRRDDARRAATDFHAQFPHSVLLSTFERMTEPDR
jgi:hypothetical protein